MRILIAIVVTFIFSNSFAGETKNDISFTLENESGKTSDEFSNTTNSLEIFNIDYQRDINDNIYLKTGISFGDGSSHIMYQDGYYNVTYDTVSRYKAIRFGIGFKF